MKFTNSQPFYKNIQNWKLSVNILMLINNNIGKQKDYKLCGKIIKLNYPENKKIGNKYSIFIKRELEKDTIELNVPKNEYVEKQNFEKGMKIGSLKIIYSEK